MKVLLFGAVLWDIIEGQEHLGGAPFNVAAHLAQCGVHSFIVTRVGNDERGQRVLAQIERMTQEQKVVDTRFLTIDPIHPTGTVTVELDDRGQPNYKIHESVAWDYIALDDLRLKVLSTMSFDAIYFGSLDQRSAVSRATLATILHRLPNVPRFFDINLRQAYYSPELIRESLSRTTLFKLNADEASIVSQQLYSAALPLSKFVERVASDFNLQAVIVTRGEQGAAVWHDGKLTECPSKPVKTIDTVGAGDAFSAGFLYEYCCGRSPAEAVVIANELGGFVASHRGAIPTFSDAILAKLGLRESRNSPR